MINLFQKIFASALAALAVTGIFFIAAPSAANAKTSTSYVITTNLDATDPNDGQCSLREALVAISTFSASGPATGECAAGTTSNLITLPPATYTLTDTTVGRLVVTGNTIINGSSATTAIVQGGAGWSTGIFRVYYGANTQITGVTIRGGNTSIDSGGGIRVESTSALLFHNGIIMSNTSSNGGGGIYNAGILTVTNSTIQQNNASSSSFGGGISTDTASRTTLTNTNILTNTAGFAGGGIFNYNGSVLQMTGGSVISNSTTTDYGGGVANIFNSSATLSGTTITKNSAKTSGGGIFNGNGVAFTATNLIVNNNHAQDGGGILNSLSGIFQLNTSTIDGNITTANGGGIYNGGTFIITATTFTNNYTTNEGGGIYASGQTTMTNSTISSNQATNGGGINVADTGNLQTNFTTIVNNEAFSTGSGIRILSLGTAQIRNTMVALNLNTIASPDCYGTLGSLGYNLIGNNNNCTFASTTGDLVGTNATPINPKITPLAYLGGATKTHGLLSGSPAIDQIPSSTNGCGTTILFDQRNKSRPANSSCDIGSFEGTAFGLYLPLVVR